MSDTTTATEKVACPNGCGAQISVRGRANHLKKCPNAPKATTPADELAARIRARAEAKLDEARAEANSAVHLSDESAPAAGYIASLKRIADAFRTHDELMELLADATKPSATS